METKPPITPASFSTHSNDPQPSSRRNVPAPPIPKKVTKSLSNEKLEMFQSLNSDSPPITQRNSRAYTITAVDMRYFEASLTGNTVLLA